MKYALLCYIQKGLAHQKINIYLIDESEQMLLPAGTVETPMENIEKVFSMLINQYENCCINIFNDKELEQSISKTYNVPTWEDMNNGR